VTVQALPVITINTYPTLTTYVTVGSITGSLGVSATATQSATLSYQWYSNTTNSNNGGSVISSATTASFTIPTTLTVGTYYYFCEVRATGATSVRSNVATVNVHAVIGLPIEMITVLGGTFTMGWLDGRDGTAESWMIEFITPSHEVTLSSFSIGKYQVTQAQWVAVMGSNPSHYRGDNLPVETVSWDDIVGTSGASMVINGITYSENGFIYKLNQLTGKQYRLPTEAEWEYAARGGNQSNGYTYSGSNSVDNVAWYWINSGSSTKPVGTKAPNELGIYDMSGNVMEPCSDRIEYYTSEAKTNPAFPSSSIDNSFVIRGGSFFSHAEQCRVFVRYSYQKHQMERTMGFRLALSH